MDETLDPSELSYHSTVVAQMEAAQVVANSWSGHLMVKYKLAPADTISREGQIIRQKGSEDGA